MTVDFVDGVVSQTAATLHRLERP